jgi:hypothetical protein
MRKIGYGLLLIVMLAGAVAARARVEETEK